MTCPRSHLAVAAQHASPTLAGTPVNVSASESRCVGISGDRRLYRLVAGAKGDPVNEVARRVGVHFPAACEHL
jgi:hypothetical protein